MLETEQQSDQDDQGSPLFIPSSLKHSDSPLLNASSTEGSFESSEESSDEEESEADLTGLSSWTRRKLSKPLEPCVLPPPDDFGPQDDFYLSRFTAGGEARIGSDQPLDSGEESEDSEPSGAQLSAEEEPQQTSNEPEHELKIRNLPYALRQDALCDWLRRVNVHPASVEIEYEDSGRPAGRAIAYFHHASEMSEAATAMQGMIIGGREIRVNEIRRRSGTGEVPRYFLGKTSSVRCYHCGKPGHIRDQCPLKSLSKPCVFCAVRHGGECGVRLTQPLHPWNDRYDDSASVTECMCCREVGHAQCGKRRRTEEGAVDGMVEAVELHEADRGDGHTVPLHRVLGELVSLTADPLPSCSRCGERGHTGSHCSTYTYRPRYDPHRSQRHFSESGRGVADQWPPPPPMVQSRGTSWPPPPPLMQRRSSSSSYYSTASSPYSEDSRRDPPPPRSYSSPSSHLDAPPYRQYDDDHRRRRGEDYYMSSPSSNASTSSSYYQIPPQSGPPPSYFGNDQYSDRYSRRY